MRIPLLLGLLLPGATLLTTGCSYSLEEEIGSTRAQIVEMEKNVPAEAPIWIFEGPDRFDQFLEDPDARVPEHIHNHIVRKLHDMRIEDIEGQSKGDFDPDAALRDPGSFRGRIWRVHGVIGQFSAEPVSDPKLPLRHVHSGILFDSVMRPVLFHVTLKPEVLTLREDAVETQGIFVKWIEYTSRSGKRVTAPFFIGKILRRYL